MSQADFAYAMAADSAGLPLGVSIFADRAALRNEWRDDVAAAGLALRECAALDALLGDEPRPLGELVLVDCPAPDAAALAALCRLDERAARSGARLVVSTSMAGLDAVFGCCNLSTPQLLVSPLRAERVIALGRSLAELPNLRLRELSEDDRLTLLRLTEQVSRLGEKLERLAGGAASGQAEGGGAFRFESPGSSFRGAEEGDRLVRAARPPLPDPRLVRRIILQRQLRAKFLDGELFADPAWDMLLDLTAARAEHNRVSVTSLCIASGVPPTTALRWIGQLTAAGLFERAEDDTDRRRAFIQLTDKAVDAMARYFHDLGKKAAQLV